MQSETRSQNEVSSMKRSISNIGWKSPQDEQVYNLMLHHGFSGLEIAPTRIFPQSPYDNLSAAQKWAAVLKTQYGFLVPSMQSIWFGKQEKLFGSQQEWQELLNYTKKAVDFAAAIGCRNLVFGCPRNRAKPDGADDSAAVTFFRQIGDYAAEKGTVIGMEANPPIYNTNYINDTAAALDLIRRVNSLGFKLNLDTGTMIQNRESVDVLAGSVDLINHVHISEPGLRPIKKRELHSNLSALLRAENYSGYISIEMGAQENIADLALAMEYVTATFPAESTSK